MPAEKATADASVSSERLERIRQYISENAPLVAKGTRITVDEKDVESLLPAAVAASPSLKENLHNWTCWIWGGQKKDPMAEPEKLKKSLMAEFNRVAAKLPFDAAELDRQPQNPKRHIIMAEPLQVTYADEENVKIDTYREWFCVKHALLKAGAQVDTIPANAKGGMREVYTRDRYVMIGDTAYLPDPEELQGLNDDGELDTGEQDIEWYKGEIAQVKEELESRGVKTVTVTGAWFEGGNVVRLSSSRTLCVGIDGAWSSEDSADRLVDAINATQDKKWTLLPVPLADPDVMYHLDTGMSEELPKGEVMISPKVTDQKTYQAIIDIVGADKIIKLSNAEARKLATNMIDVGNTLVMTGNCKKLSAKLESRGYDLIQPKDYKLPDFEFGAGGVHCMTNDVRQPRRKPAMPRPV
ncbi:MAG: hypothetical protein ACAH80_09285 [Alphaproteobacteria bacterium]